jgi:hypothetical protein
MRAANPARRVLARILRAPGRPATTDRRASWRDSVVVAARWEAHLRGAEPTVATAVLPLRVAVLAGGRVAASGEALYRLQVGHGWCLSRGAKPAS